MAEITARRPVRSREPHPARRLQCLHRPGTYDGPLLWTGGWRAHLQLAAVDRRVPDRPRREARADDEWAVPVPAAAWRVGRPDLAVRLGARRRLRAGLCGGTHAHR